MTTRSADAVVIGAGVIGSSVALELARGGRRVVVVDRGPAAGAGSTSASSAIIRFSYSTPDAILTAWEAAAMWHRWSDHLGGIDPDGMATFIECPNLTFRTTGYEPDDMVARWREYGIDHEELDADAVNRRFPALDVGRYFPPKPIDDPAFGDDPDGRLTAVLCHGCGFVDDPMLAAKNLAWAAKQHGATFRFGAEVVAIDRDDMVRGVTLADGTSLAAPIVVNVGGPHSAHLNRLAGVTDDMTIGHRPLRQEVFVVSAPAGTGLDEGGPFVADVDLGQYFRPHPGGSMMIGSTEPDCDELVWVDDPDENSPYPTVEVWETAMLRFARRVPGFRVPNAPTGLASLYDVADDWVPIYDRSSLPGFFMACATSGNQFKNAPIAGMFMRSIIDAVSAGHDHDADPVEFTGPRTGRSIDLGAFSRRRQRASTTNSVLG